jgi:hypothetical protein
MRAAQARPAAMFADVDAVIRIHGRAPVEPQFARRVHAGRRAATPRRCAHGLTAAPPFTK